MATNTKAYQAVKLKNYIYSIQDFKLIQPGIYPYRHHIGAILTDIILQAGLNYNAIVLPRVQSIIHRFPEAVTLHDFVGLIDTYGLEDILQFRNFEKLKRMMDLINFLQRNRIDTVTDLMSFVSQNNNLDLLKGIKGIGDKTSDYLMILLGFDVIAVDRHIKSFLHEAAIECKDYLDIKLIVSYTADMMEVPRRCLDFSIWNYKNKKSSLNKIAYTPNLFEEY